MANTARDESLTRPRGGGGKLNRSETVTIRLDPKLNYLCELAARAQRRTKSSFIEWAIQHTLSAVQLPDVEKEFSSEPVLLSEWAQRLWQVDEADRVMMLALNAPALLTHEEQVIWRVVREWGGFWLGTWTGANAWEDRWSWHVSESCLEFQKVRGFWEEIKAVALDGADTSRLPPFVKRQPKPGKKAFPVPTDLDDDVPF